MTDENSQQEMREILERPFPPEAIKQRQGGGGRMLDYVSGETVIRRLNEATGNWWDFTIKSLELHGDLWICVGQLAIPGVGTREGIGVQRVSERGGEDLVKGAATDALKKAATLFGVGLDLYGPDLEAEAPRAVADRAPGRKVAREQVEQIVALLGDSEEHVRKAYPNVLRSEFEVGRTEDLTAADAELLIERLSAALYRAASQATLA